MNFKTELNNGDFAYFIFGQKVHTGEVCETRAVAKSTKAGIHAEYDIKDSDGKIHTIETRYAFKTRKELIKSL